VEFSQVVALCAIGLTLFNTAYAVVIRAMTTDKDFRKELQDLRDRMLIFEYRSKPTWDALERRLADILHQPHHASLDAFLDRIARGGADELTDDELVQAIERVSDWEREVSRGGAQEDPVQWLAATLMRAFLAGRKAEREFLKKRQLEGSHCAAADPWWQRWLTAIVTWTGNSWRR
jgi:hypothetical protein